MGRGARCRPRFLAEKLRQIRDGLNLSQAELVDHLGLVVKPHEISDFERGVRDPDLLTLKAYASSAARLRNKLTSLSSRS
jgi:transcriptional regulator with XRE-family HTH domain